jgi:hypothetical protein
VFLKQAKAGITINDFCRCHGLNDAAFYTRRRKFGGMEVTDAINAYGRLESFRCKGKNGTGVFCPLSRYRRLW